jgi:hypothetical protein
LGPISLSPMERVGSGGDVRSSKRLAREARASSRGELRFRSTHGVVGSGKVEGVMPVYLKFQVRLHGKSRKT